MTKEEIVKLSAKRVGYLCLKMRENVELIEPFNKIVDESLSVCVKDTLEKQIRCIEIIMINLCREFEEMK
jgi:hypothetical protein